MGIPPSHHLSTLLGEIIDAWSGVEHGLAFLFQAVAGCSHAQANAIFWSVRGIKEQREMTTALARVTVSAPELLKEITDAMEKLRASAEKRNAILHARWLEKQDPNYHGRMIYFRAPSLPVMEDNLIMLFKREALARGKNAHMRHQKMNARRVFHEEDLVAARQESADLAGKLMELAGRIQAQASEPNP
jgi:hypothetical protein